MSRESKLDASLVRKDQEVGSSSVPVVGLRLAQQGSQEPQGEVLKAYKHEAYQWRLNYDLD